MTVPLDSFHLSGRLSKFRLGDVLQLLALSELTGRLDLRCADPLAQGRIFVMDGCLMDAELVASDSGDGFGMAALERIMAWTDGHFTFVQGARAAQERINLPITAVLLDAHHRSDERKALLAALPPSSEIPRIAPHPKEIPVLTAPEWGVLALVNGKRSIQRIAEKHGDDVAALRHLQALFSKGALVTGFQEPEQTWQRLVPLPVPTTAVQGERSFPARLRANLLLKEVDGRRSLGEVNGKLALPVPLLLDEVRYLCELRWIRFSAGDAKRFEGQLHELVGQ